MSPCPFPLFLFHCHKSSPPFHLPLAPSYIGIPCSVYRTISSSSRNSRLIAMSFCCVVLGCCELRDFPFWACVRERERERERERGSVCVCVCVPPLSLSLALCLSLPVSLSLAPCLSISPSPCLSISLALARVVIW